MKKDKNIDKLIKESLDVEKTSMDFSKNVMQQIYTSEKEREKALFSLIQKSLLERPSAGFTSGVISLVKTYSKTSIYTPVISKKVWVLITSLYIALMGYTVFNLNMSQPYFIWLDAYILDFRDDLSFNLPSITLPSVLTSPLFAVSIFALSSLLLLDYIIRNRKLALKI